MKFRMLLILLLGSSIVQAKNRPPQLILQLVVDQLRGDLLYQYQPKLTKNGFNYLLAHGINYQNAHHPHANTVTCVGHATIATGSYPSLHGIIANDWYDRKSNQLKYCTDDADYKILPTERTKQELTGSSPRNLMVSTLSDELMLARKGKAFAVAIKDRSAITLAGHAGKAFWFDKLNGGFITSQYYYADYPAWVNAWNNKYIPHNITWTLSKAEKNYQYVDAPRAENRFPSFGQSFPHHTGNSNEANYYKFLTMTPAADEITANFAVQLLKNENLGKVRGKTDYLAISFSAVDSVGHQFGPNSLESEDNILRLDNTLARLLTVIDGQVGLQNTLIVLTADHGVSDSPDYLAAHKMNTESRINVDDIAEKIKSLLTNHYKLPKSTFLAVVPPYVYFDHEIISNHHISQVKLNEQVAEFLQQQSDIFRAFPIPLRNVADSWLSAKVDRMFYPQRSGDVYVITPPNFGSIEELKHVNHGSPWQYDSYVPLLFVSPSFKTQTIVKPVYTTDIAPTLAAILKIKYPSGTVGRPLAEVANYY